MYVNQLEPGVGATTTCLMRAPTRTYNVDTKVADQPTRDRGLARLQQSR